jgi:hypothetical protein
MVDRDHGVPNPGINICICVDRRPWRYFTPTEWVQGCSIGEIARAAESVAQRFDILGIGKKIAPDTNWRERISGAE